MKITINVTDELLEKANGDLTITLNYKKSEELESPKPSVVEKIVTKAQGFLSGDRSSKSNATLSFSELNSL